TGLVIVLRHVLESMPGSVIVLVELNLCWRVHHLIRNDNLKLGQTDRIVMILGDKNRDNAEDDHRHCDDKPVWTKRSEALDRLPDRPVPPVPAVLGDPGSAVESRGPTVRPHDPVHGSPILNRPAPL